MLGGLVDVTVDAVRDQLLLDATLADHFQGGYRRRILVRGSPSPLLPAIDLDQLVDDPLGDHDELQRLMWLLNGKQDEARQRVNGHYVVKVPLNCLVQLAHNRLRRVDRLQTCLVLPFLGVHQRQELKRQHLLLPVQVKGVVSVQSHEVVPCPQTDPQELLKQLVILVEQQNNRLNIYSLKAERFKKIR